MAVTDAESKKGTAVTRAAYKGLKEGKEIARYVF